MRLTIPALLACGILGLCLAVSEKPVRWCTVSDQEDRKCTAFKNQNDDLKKGLDCVRKSSHYECIEAIANKGADAVTLDGGLVFDAGQAPYNLKPVVAEYYGSKENPQTSYYAVAVVKKGSGFQLNQLQGKKSCHTGINRSAGWKIPMGTLYPELSEPQEDLQKAAANFFGGSCVPGVDPNAYPKLCQLCAGKGKDKCAFSHHEPYFGYSGALKCLMDGAGEVAFVKHLTVLDDLPNQAERDQYELLCRDNTRKPVDKYEECHLAIVPSHAVVARSVDGKEDLIWELLNQAQERYGRGTSGDFQLFSSSEGKNLLFKDSTQGFLKVPPKMDAWMYLGYEYVSVMKNLKENTRPDPSTAGCNTVKWCAIGHQERLKCDEWSVNSKGKVACESAETTEDCIAMIMKGEADAMSLDGGFIYIAGKCGLVPVLAENYKTTSNCVNTPERGYLAVAVVKSSSSEDLTWETLQNKKSCHTAVDRTAGWNIPMGLIYNRLNHCEFDKFFSQGCAPGYAKTSSLCALCIGSASVPGKECEPNNNERYYGYTGALRCLVESGDVAFVKEETVLQNTGGKNTEDWAKNLKQEDFKLLCPDGTRKPVSEAENCHLARSPNHGVVSRQDKAACVRQVLLEQQTLFGKNENDCLSDFCLFQSKTKDLLFKDDTKCLAELQERTTYESYLGAEYVTAVGNLKQCSTSKLLEACTFHKHVTPKTGP
uniref:Transferrin n=1 Tax=Pipistrellus kuhlii TaxID=59472 RepID=A0A7J7WFB3_PIPKU|nr:transferrin [Pipistrellus kuhlii]